MSAEKSEVEKFYTKTYAAYIEANYGESYALSREALGKYGKSDFAARFEFIKAMSQVKLRGPDSLEHNLKLLVAKYPNSEVTPLSNSILESIRKQKNPEPEKPNQQPLDTFQVNMNGVHLVIAILPDNQRAVSDFQSKLGNFNSIYYSDKKFEMSSLGFIKDKQLLVIKKFDNGREAFNYIENVNLDQDMFKGEVKKEQVELYPITLENYQLLYRKKNPASYKLFVDDNYKKLNSKN
jgi:hypothetical protein